MCSNQNGLACCEVGLDVRLPVGKHTAQNVLQALGARSVLNIRVAGVVCLRVGVVVIQRGRRNVVGTTPRHELLVAVFLADLGLILTLQSTVVTLVQTPGALDGNPQAVCSIQCKVCGVDCATLQGGVNNIGEDVALCQQLAATLSLSAALIGQVNVHPTGEQVLFIPLGLAVAQEY